MLLSLIVGLLLGVLTITFALQNVAEVNIIFFTWSLQGSLALVLLVAFAAGVFTSALISIPQVVRNYLKFSNLRKQNKKLEIEFAEQKRLLDEANAKLAIAYSTPAQAPKTNSEPASPTSESNSSL